MTLHSNRGGVGKTLVAINLAMVYAKLGRAVCLIDLDFRAPSLSAVLRLHHPNLWMNDFLDHRGKLGDALIDVSSKYDFDGKLLVGLADPSLHSVKNMAGKDKRWEVKALKMLISVKRELAENGVDFIIFDTSPGMLYSSVNAVACSDVVVVVATADILDVEETQRMITDLYAAFEKPTYVVLNKVMPWLQWEKEDPKTVHEKFTTMLSAPILSIIPCYCDLLHTRKVIHTTEMSNHPFSKVMLEAANKLSAITS